MPARHTRHSWLELLVSSTQLLSTKRFSTSIYSCNSAISLQSSTELLEQHCQHQDVVMLSTPFKMMLFCYKIIIYSIWCHYAQKFRIVSTQDTKRSCRIESVLGIGFWSDPTWSVLSLHSFFRTRSCEEGGFFSRLHLGAGSGLQELYKSALFYSLGGILSVRPGQWQF